MTKKRIEKRIRISVNTETFKKVEELLKTINMTPSQVIGMMFTQILLHKKIPFDINIKASSEDD